MKQIQQEQRTDPSADFMDEAEDLKKISYPIGTMGHIGWIFSITGILFLIIGISVTAYSGMGIFMLSFGLIGAIFAMLGITFLKKIYSRIKHEKRAVESGQYIYAPVVSITLNEHLEVNGRNPWIITASYDDPIDNSHHDFKSRNVFRDVSMIQPGDMVRIYVNAPDYDAYYMDVDELRRSNTGEG